MTGWLRHALTPDGRRALAFVAIVLGCAVMTGFAAVGVWLVRGNAGLSFWLALAAHAQILTGLTALGALLVKRNVRIGRDGVEVSDHVDSDKP